jgi:hypothetical protein
VEKESGERNFSLSFETRHGGRGRDTHTDKHRSRWKEREIKVEIQRYTRMEEKSDRETI